MKAPDSRRDPGESPARAGVAVAGPRARGHRRALGTATAAIVAGALGVACGPGQTLGVDCGPGQTLGPRRSDHQAVAAGGPR